MFRAPLVVLCLAVVSLLVVQPTVALSRAEAGEALIEAILKGSSDGMHDAVEAGADVNGRSDSGGRTALHLAITTGRRDLVMYLLNQGADTFAVSNTGHTTLIYAVITKLGDISEMLIGTGVDVNAQVASWTKVSAGSAALHFAVLNEDHRCIRILIAAGADKKLLNEAGQSPIDLAIASDDSARLLLALGEDPERLLNQETVRTQLTMKGADVREL